MFQTKIIREQQKGYFGIVENPEGNEIFRSPPCSDPYVAAQYASRFVQESLQQKSLLQSLSSDSSESNQTNSSFFRPPTTSRRCCGQ